MTLSDISVRRPVLALVLSLLVIAFGAVAFTLLPLRELPNVDQPVVSVRVLYPGASAQVVETQVTKVIEDQLSGIDGIDLIRTSTRDGRSQISIEFNLSRNLDDAANDVRNAVSRVQGQLPEDIQDPVVSKSDADSDPILWLALGSTTMGQTDLTDYANRYIADRLSVLNGVASVTVGGGLDRALRIWIDADALAARGLTVSDVEDALRTQNVELPAGFVQSQERDYQVRVNRAFQTPEEFARLPLRPGVDPSAPVVRLGDVARIELGAVETRRFFRGNGQDLVGLGIVRQSNANALEVSRAVKAEVEQMRQSLPPGVTLEVTDDSTVFIDRAIQRVGQTLLESTVLVVVVIFLFLGTARAAFVPAAVIPVCLVGAFAIMSIFGFSVNLMTLLALVLAIGLVVDDFIVVLENTQRRMDEYGEPALIAAERGARQVFFAVIATSAVLVAVFTPLLFVGGYVGKLFVELAVTIAGVVAISAFASLSLSPMMCSKLLRPVGEGTRLSRAVDSLMNGVRRSYRASLEAALNAKYVVLAAFAFIGLGGLFLFTQLPSELSPAEDRGNIFVSVTAPEGSGFEYTSRIMHQVEAVLTDYVRSGEGRYVITSAPGFNDAGTNRFSNGAARLSLEDWDKRHRSGIDILTEVNRKLGQIPGAIIRARMRSPFATGGGGGGDGPSIVLLGSDYDTLSATAQRIVARLRDNPNLQRPRADYEPNAPRVEVTIDRERAAALGITVQSIGDTLEATMGQARVTTFTDRGEEYDVYVQAERNERSNVSDLNSKYVRSARTGELAPLSSVVNVRVTGDTAERRRFNRQAAVTISATTAANYPIGRGIAAMEQAARAEIGNSPISIDYTGAARQFKQSSGAIGFAFGFALIVVFLLLAAQFESFIHPIVIMMTVPLAVAGGLFGLYLFDGSLNIYSQIGLIILVALAAKNGILIVEFANQLRDEGKGIREAILEASDLRLRPVLMTSIATVIGALPLALAHGAGAESRQTIGIVIFFGLVVATMLTLFVAPVFYDLLAKYTKSPDETAREIDRYAAQEAVAKAAE